MKAKTVLGQTQPPTNPPGNPPVDPRWQTKTPTMTEEELSQVWDESEIGGYGLNLTDKNLLPKEEIVPIRDDWIKATTGGSPFYIVDPEGKIWMVSVDNAGVSITVHEVITTYTPQAPSVNLTGPDAWKSLDEIFPKYTVVPPSAFGASNVQAHVAAVRDPIWFTVVQNIIKRHRAVVKNPYRKSN